MGQLSTQTDEALLQSALGGCGAAWDELVDRYHPRGFRYVRRSVDDPQAVRDIMQNVWENLVVTVRRQEPDRFAALFWTLLKRRLIDELRRRGRAREAAVLDAPLSGREGEHGSRLDLQGGAGPDPLQEAIRSEAHSVLHTALGQLPDHYRRVIEARHFRGFSNRESAALLVAEGLVTDDGHLEKRVENYYYRGLKELRRQLEALGYAGGGNLG